MGRSGSIARAAVLACVASPFAVADGAQAAVDIGPQRIVVSGPQATATIDRQPFRVSFAPDPGREPVLDEVANRRPDPRLLLPIPDPEPLGLDNLTGPTLYSPLTFTVGVRADAQFPATPWVGNELVGLELGVQYAARDVIDARRLGDGVDLLLSTNDPTGRTLSVRIAPHRGTMRVRARPSDPSGVVAMSDSFATAPREAFRGFGGRHNALDQRGEDFYNWVEQQNVGAGPLEPLTELLPGAGGEGYMFPNGPTAAYYVQSQFVSSDGYGFLLDRPELSGWRMASDRPDAWQVTAAAPALDYVVAPGSAARAIGTLTAITGRHRAPPGWAVGPQLDRLTRFSGETPQTYKRSVLDDLEQIERHDLPLTAYRIEAWAWLEPAFLRRVIAALHRRGIRALLYFRAFVGRDEIGTDLPAHFDEALRNRWVATTAGGDPYLYVGNFNNLTAQIDFTDPGARRWWRERIHAALDLGADGFMQDFGEQVQNGMHFDDGSTGAEMHNRYPVLFHRVTRDAIDSYERRHPGRRIWFFTRSGYSGTPGSAAYEGANFPGDETTDWSRSSGLASLTTDMLNRGIGGAYGFGTDIGGYFDFHTPPTTKELFLRWAAWSALSPLMRLHGSINAGTHAPWTFDAETVRQYNRLSHLHLRARPLIMRLWRHAERTGIPIARPLWLHYPGDDEAARQDQEWLLGRDVLVAPVVEQGAGGRVVSFPAGCWRDPGTGASHLGPDSAFVASPLGDLPYFTRCGTRPFGNRVDPNGSGDRG